MTTMSNTRRGLPITSSRIEKIFPKLTSAQIRRVEAHGHVRAVQRGEVLYDQGDTSAPFFVVITGELEVVHPLFPVETLVTVIESGQFTGEVGTLSGRRTLFHVRASMSGKVTELDRGSSYSGLAVIGISYTGAAVMGSSNNNFGVRGGSLDYIGVSGLWVLTL